jgi:hypothetical protein
MNAQPIPLPPPRQSLREAVRAALRHSSNPDPCSVIPQLWATLTDDQYEEAARFGLRELLREETRMRRNTAMNRASAPASPRWQHGGQVARKRQDLFGVSVTVGIDSHGAGIMRFLGDCTREDLEAAAQILREKGDVCHARAKRYAALGCKLKGSAVVRSLPYKTVEGVFK